MKSFSLIIAVLIGATVCAQDTSRPKQVNVTSTFKPVLKEAAKVNFNATPPLADTTRPRLQYQIPNQNLAFAFQPGSLKPMALDVDTLGRWDNESFIKLGFGSLKTPYILAGLSLGDGKTAGANVYAKHISSKGKIPHQDFSSSSMDLNAFFQTAKSLEWNARFGGILEEYNRYGYEPKTLVIPDDSLAIKYQTWRGRVSFHNINETAFGLSYAPEFKMDIFSDQWNNTESSTYIKLPLRKDVGKIFSIDLAIEGNLTRYKPDEKDAIRSNYLSLAPTIFFRTPNVSIHAGIKPSWDNSNFKLFPNVMAELSSPDKKFTVQAGWIGYMRNSGYQYQAGINPWILPPDNIYNTGIEELYAGLKGSVGDHFSYGAKLAYNKWTNQPLFTNIGNDGKSFVVINEPQMKVINIGGEMGLTFGERFSLISNVQFNKYDPTLNDKAWGLLPMEFKTSVRIQVLKDLYVNSDLYAFDNAWALTTSGQKHLQGAFDLNAGLEFKIVRNVKLWAQFNNIFNREYQRWNQYPVYGFNFLGGAVFSFAQKTK